MDLHLNNSEIEDAIVAYVAEQGITLGGMDVVVSLTAGRGPAGYTACVKVARTVAVGNAKAAVIVEQKDAEPAAVTKPVVRKPRAKPATASSKETPADAGGGEEAVKDNGSAEPASTESTESSETASDESLFG